MPHPHRPSMPMSQDMCGRCLRLTNLRTQAQEIVRIVDQCGHSCEWAGAGAGRSAGLDAWDRALPCWVRPTHCKAVCCMQCCIWLRAAPQTPACANCTHISLAAALDLDWDTSFKPLDGDGQGYNDGRMGVAVELVEC